MLGIKKMMKDDDATGILGAVSGGLFGVFPAVCAAILSLIPACGLGCLAGCAADILAPLAGCGAGCFIGLPICGALLGGAGGAGILGALTATWFASAGGLIGTFIDYIVTMAPCATVCLTPTIGVLAAACSAIVGSFGFSLGAGTGLLGAIFG